VLSIVALKAGALGAILTSANPFFCNIGSDSCTNSRVATRLETSIFLGRHRYVVSSFRLGNWANLSWSFYIVCHCIAILSSIFHNVIVRTVISNVIIKTRK
jgi:hypothetical protein